MAAPGDVPAVGVPEPPARAPPATEPSIAAQVLDLLRDVDLPDPAAVPLAGAAGPQTAPPVLGRIMALLEAGVAAEDTTGAAFALLGICTQVLGNKVRDE